MAFILSKYHSLLAGLIARGYKMAPVKAYFEEPVSPAVFLRHDVDRLLFRAVAMARLEAELGVSATYYFRCNPRGVFPEESIREIAELGHEIGYHYETVVRAKGDPEKAFELFNRDLKNLREIAPVCTVAAHGSPLAELSNMGYAGELDYNQLELLGEPSVNFDFEKVLYLTDTGGAFNSSCNVRDKVSGRKLEGGPYSPLELLDLLNPSSEPVILLNTHPERWPVGQLGLFQASLMDLAVNFAKRALKKV
ncbi:MAG: hypothetical protein D6719_14035 [Candidatus Dadabacteria bacterium]|nr:MAG: hypothetical protein D6719_14035 [Candidatus Dadabacteria bacterium]